MKQLDICIKKDEIRNLTLNATYEEIKQITRNPQMGS
jgi:hypothetical protein